jgi:recombination protein RecA
LDLAFGVGGLSVGRVTEIYGPESSGKTTLALHVIAEAQKQGKYSAFIDAEHALNPQWASKLGVNTNELLISQPDSGEQALEIVDSLIKYPPHLHPIFSRNNNKAWQSWQNKCDCY